MVKKYTDCWLGIDCGGTMIKAGLYDEHCHEIGFFREALPARSQKPGWAERDMHELREACFVCVRNCLKAADIDNEAIKCIAISAQGKGLYAVDKNGNPAPTGILSADRRATEIVRDWNSRHIKEQLYKYTRQALWTGHPASILRWLKDNRRADYDAITDVMMSHDYLRFCLTGQRACEITNISESNLYNMNTAGFDPEILKLLGIEEVSDKLPPVVESTQICGYVNAESAKATGLKEGTPVAGGLFDVISVAVCAGALDELTINAAMGTWAVASGIVTGLPPEDGYVYGRHTVKGKYIIHEASPTSSGNLEWICKTLGESDFTRINAMVAGLKKASTDIFFVPFLYGTNAHLDATGCFYGLQNISGKAELFQAAFEGVVFAHMKHINSIRAKLSHATHLVVTGGSGHSKVWMQILADTAALPVLIPRVEETGCLGAAIVAQVASGLYPDTDTARKSISIDSSVVEPDPSSAAAYQHKLKRYEDLISCINRFEDLKTQH